MRAVAGGWVRIQPPVRLDPLFRILFVVYCVEAGLFLFVSPWTPSWERLIAVAPWDALSDLALSAPSRGLVSGFGLVHLLWAMHDVDLMLRRLPRSESAGVPPEGA